MANGMQGNPEGLPQPVLYVGLGGTGRDVLLRVRRWMYEKFRVRSLPFTEFLYLDTDPSGKLPSGMSDAIFDHIAFRRTEKIAMGMTPTEVQNYLKGGEVGRGLSRDAIRPKDWLDPRLDKYAAALQEGAGQIRIFGRLAFWNRAREFQERIQHALRALTKNNLDARAKELGYEGVNPGAIKIVVVASLAGGTGAGSFLDAAILLRDTCNKFGQQCSLHSVLVLPTVFENLDIELDHTILQANGYAAMMELDAHMLPPMSGKNPQYVFPGVSPEVDVTYPVYNMVWIVDGATSDGTRFDDPTEPIRACAEALMLELDQSEAAQAFRTDISNWQNQIAEILPVKIVDNEGELLYSLPLHKRYAAFGIAQVVMDRDRLRNGAAFRLGEMILTFMLRRDESLRAQQSSYIQQDIENDEVIGLTQSGLQRLLLTRGDHYVLEELEELVNESCREIDGHLKENLKQGSDENPLDFLSRVKDGLAQRHDEYQRALERLRKEVAQKLNREGTRAQHGAHHKMLEDNTRSAEGRLKKRIEATVIDFLTDPVERGLAAADELVSLLESTLERLRSRDTTRTPVSVPQIPEASGGDRIDAATRRHAEAQLIPGFVYPFRKIALDITRAELAAAAAEDLEPLRDAARDYMAAWRAYILADLRAKYLERTDPIVTKVVTSVANWLGEEQKIRTEGGKVEIKRTGIGLLLEQYEKNLGEMRDNQDAMARAFADAKRGTRNVFVDNDQIVSRLLFKHCMADADENDIDQLREALMKAMAEFFRSATLISAETMEAMAEADAAAEVRDAAIREGMKELVKRARLAGDDPQQWTDVRDRLERFCFVQTKPIADHSELNAAREVSKRQDQGADAIKKVFDNSKPLVQLSPDWRDIRPKSAAFLACTKNHLNPAADWFSEAGLDVSPSKAATDRGNLTLYQNFYAMPVLSLRVLKSMKVKYKQEVRKGDVIPAMRHSTRHWRNFADLEYSPDEAYWRDHYERLYLFINAVLLGAARFIGEEEQWVTKVVRRDQLRTITLGGSVSRVLDELRENGTIRDDLRGLVNDRLGHLQRPEARDKAAAYAAACRHLLHNVYDHKTDTKEEAKTPEREVAAQLYYKAVDEILAPALGVKQPRVNNVLVEQLQAGLEHGSGLLTELEYLDGRMMARFKAVH